MSKAYDLINRNHLEKALKRIKLPNSFCTFIRNVFKFRKNKIITDVGLTQEYNVTNGIDQGEIMLLLLWIIYYDLLFTKIKRNKGIGYKIEHTWENNLSLKNK